MLAGLSFDIGCNDKGDNVLAFTNYLNVMAGVRKVVIYRCITDI